MNACDPWLGPREWYQFEARKILNVDRHLWINPTCETLLCLAGTHLATLKPEPLDYLSGICVYCGLSSNTRDHLMPRGWSGGAARSYVLTVPSCRECNAIINDRWAPTITERRALAHKGIKKKYARHLPTRQFPRAELDEMGPNLRSKIEAQLDLADVLRARLTWPPSHDYDFGACERAGFPDPYEVGLLLPEVIRT